MQKPLWIEWRWCALIQWHRDRKGIETAEPMFLANKRVPLVNGCDTERPTCLLCGGLYGAKPTFKSVLGHMHRDHPEHIARVYLQ